MLRRAAVRVTLCVALVAGCGVQDPRHDAPRGGSGPPSGEDALVLEPTDPARYAALVVSETNELRAGTDSPELTTDVCATEAATARAEQLVGRSELDHAPLDDVIASCAPPGGTAAENLSRAAASPAQVVEAWDGSPGHRANLLDPALTRVGVGCVVDTTTGPEQMLCSQVFLG